MITQSPGFTRSAIAWNRPSLVKLRALRPANAELLTNAVLRSKLYWRYLTPTFRSIATSTWNFGAVPGEEDCWDWMSWRGIAIIMSPISWIRLGSTESTCEAGHRSGENCGLHCTRTPEKRRWLTFRIEQNKPKRSGILPSLGPVRPDDAPRNSRRTNDVPFNVPY